VMLRYVYHGGASGPGRGPGVLEDGTGETAPLWTPKGVAAEVGVTVARVWQLLAEGRFPNAFKVGGRWYMTERDVRAYLAHPDRRRKGELRQGELPGVEG